MNIDNLHDALNLLDDDIIEAVDELRNKKIQKKPVWIRWASIAACLCIIFVGVYTLNRLGLNNDYKSADTQSPGKGNSAEGQATSSGGNEVMDRAEPYLVVEITSWNGDSFTGIVRENDEAQIYDIGSEATFKSTGAATSTDFPVGSVVLIKFRVPEDDVSEDRNGSITIESRTLYIESIELYSTNEQGE